MFCYFILFDLKSSAHNLLKCRYDNEFEYKKLFEYIFFTKIACNLINIQINNLINLFLVIFASINLSFIVKL
jgi:hypothetical protein